MSLIGRPATAPLTVLVFDQDHSWRRVLGRYLRSFFSVVEASDDESAMHALGEHAVDVIVADAQAGTRTAAELHARVASVSPGLQERIIFTTSGGFDAALRDFFSETTNPVLYKTLDFARVRAMIQTVFARAA